MSIAFAAPVSLEPLTPRESEVIELVCRGLSNEDISRELYISMNTVKTFIRGAYRKIGVDTRARAVIWGFQNGYGYGFAQASMPAVPTAC